MTNVLKKLAALRWKIQFYVANMSFNWESVLSPWSGLRTLGNSRLVGATMIAPFLGSLILYNQTVVDLLKLPAELLPHWMAGHSPGTDPSLLRLKLTYFGLVFIGAGSFIFTLACPRLIKQYGTLVSYVEEEQKLFTKPHSDSVTGGILSTYMERTRAMDEDHMRAHTLAYPVELKWRFHSLIEVIGEEIDAGLEQDKGPDENRANEPPSPEDQPLPDEEVSDPEQESEWDDLLNFRHYRGEFHVDKFMDVVMSGVTATRYYHREVLEKARSHTIDVMAVQYEGANWSRPILRLLIVGLYVLGFGVLAVPTLMTFWAVLRTTI